MDTVKCFHVDPVNATGLLFHEQTVKSLIDSIEMLWLNAGVQKKKTDITIPNNAKQNISRIRQLLAAAWSEDFKD